MESHKKVYVIPCKPAALGSAPSIRQRGGYEIPQSRVDPRATFLCTRIILSTSTKTLATELPAMQEET
jgi:hypothetical protein